MTCSPLQTHGVDARFTDKETEAQTLRSVPSVTGVGPGFERRMMQASSSLKSCRKHRPLCGGALHGPRLHSRGRPTPSPGPLPPGHHGGAPHTVDMNCTCNNGFCSLAVSSSGTRPTPDSSLDPNTSDVLLGLAFPARGESPHGPWPPAGTPQPERAWSWHHPPELGSQPPSSELSGWTVAEKPAHPAEETREVDRLGQQRGPAWLDLGLGAASRLFPTLAFSTDKQVLLVKAQVHLLLGSSP